MRNPSAHGASPAAWPTAWPSVLRMKRTKTVLLIEDEPEVRLLFRLALEAAGFLVFAADRGTDGLAQYRAQPTDLVVIDLLLPDMDGASAILELTRELPAPRIVAMSGGTGDLLDTARDLGAARVLRKPFGPKQLVHVLEELSADTGGREDGAPLKEVVKGER